MGAERYFYPIILSFVTFLATLAGGYLTAKNRSKFGFIASFATGVLIAVSLFQLIPISLQLAANTNVSSQIILYMVGLGFIFLYMLERLLSVKKVMSEGKWKYVRHSTGGIYGASELVLHSFVDGFSIGVGFHFNIQIGIIIALAVIFHDFPDGMNTVTVMLNAGNSLRSSLRMLMLDAITPVIGAVASLFITSIDQYLVYLLPFFAGGFLYLGASGRFYRNQNYYLLTLRNICLDDWVLIRKLDIPICQIETAEKNLLKSRCLNAARLDFSKIQPIQLSPLIRLCPPPANIYLHFTNSLASNQPQYYFIKTYPFNHG
jgi:zinc transporter ZupT